jgi:hypothetical protein
MKPNVGAIDRLLRIIIGIAIAVVGVVYQSYWGIVGIAILTTGLFGYCPVYAILKISSITKK